LFALANVEGPGYAPPACTAPIFADVPAANPSCRWISRAEMAVFLVAAFGLP
jgi:hypothetical protein